jgi:CelD/BcsL family acetyltransferase involved in cellulose biosynthesis
MRSSEIEMPLEARFHARSDVNSCAGSAFVAECSPVYYNTDLEPLLAGLDGNPFQSLPVLTSWFATFSGRGDARECFLATLRDEHGVLVFALPLIRRKVAGLMRIELPHSGVIDFTTPFVRRTSAARLPAPATLWDLIREALPPADLLVFCRIDQGADACRNPLYVLPQSQASRFVTWRVEPLHARAERHAELAKAYRKKLRRNREKFLELPGARFVVARTVAEALPFLEWMEPKQGERIRGKGLDYGLDCPRVKDFYRRLVQGGVETGQTLLVGMMVGDEIIAAGFSILSRREAVYVRVAADLGAHAALTPGLLVTDFAMDEAHARGITQFDFGMGDYHFKRQLGGKANPLRDLILPLSWKGYPLALWLRARQWASVHPLMRKVLGRKALVQLED